MNDPVMCPVQAWATTIQWILNYPIDPKELMNIPINMAFVDSKRFVISAELLLAKICSNMAIIGKDALGFGPSDVGTHSNHSAAAMAMYLAGVLVYTIMLIGQWSSDAFLKYIHHQVLTFSNSIAVQMITNDYK